MASIESSFSRRFVLPPPEESKFRLANMWHMKGGVTWVRYEVLHNSDYFIPLGSCEGIASAAYPDDKTGLQPAWCLGCHIRGSVDRTAIMLEEAKNRHFAGKVQELRSV